MSDVRILLLCSSRFALQTMQELVFFNQVAAIAIPAHCDEWREHAAAVLQGISVPVIIVEKATYVQQLQEAVVQYNANMGLMITFSFRIPASVYSIPELGFFNVHPSPLPAYRGPDPIFFQIKNREKQTGVTIHKLESAWDTGAIVMRELVPVRATDTYGLLSYRLSMLASRLVNNLVKLAGFGLELPLKPQDETKASYHKKQTAADVSISWERMDAGEIIAQINACNPWNKGASTRLEQRIIRLLEATLSPESSLSEPGTILGFTEKEMMVCCADQRIISVSIISGDEGIMHAGRLVELGAFAGQKLLSI